MSKLPTLINLTTELASIRSVTGDVERCNEVLSYCTRHLEDLPEVRVRLYEHGVHPSLVACYKADKEPEVLFSGHVDVVDASTENCFTPRHEGELLKGRGVFDMKGAVAAMMRAFVAHVESGSPVSAGLMITTDEETGGAHGTKYVLDEQGYRPKFVIVPDGGGPDVALISHQRGLMWLDVSMKGETAHASRPEQGRSAILDFFAKYDRLAKALAHVPETSLCLTELVGTGIAINAVPDDCNGHIDIRTTDPDRVRKVVASIFDANEFVISKEEASFIADMDHPRAEAFRSCLEAELGESVGIQPETGASDARFFADLQIPTIVCSVRGGNHHGPNEWVDIQSLEVLEKTLVRFLRELV